MQLFSTIFGMLFFAGLFSISDKIDTVKNFHDTHKHITKCVGYHEEHDFVPIFWYGNYNDTAVTYIDIMYVTEFAVKDYFCKLLLISCLYICMAFMETVQYIYKIEPNHNENIQHLDKN